MGYLLGIDVGTTRTAAAVHRTDTPVDHVLPEMVTLGDHSLDQPSVVFLLPDGSLLVGDAAERRAMAEPERVAREFKRRVGDPTPVTMGGRAFAAQELAAVLVRHVLDVVTRREGGLPDRVTVTHPASWGTHKLDLLTEALDAVLPMPVEFLAEPQAAAVCYAAAERVEPGSTIAVYDLGGGTFDSAVVRKEPAGGFTLLGRPEGLEFLGGVDFDEVVFEHVRAGATDAFAGLDEADPAVWAAVARLRRECREAKEGLSSDTEVSVPVWLGGAQTVVRLHRSEFEELIGPRIEDSVDALRRAVESAGLDPSELSSVLLVGGSSRIPLVAQTVSERLGRPVAVDADPKNAIAKGAALAMLPRRATPRPRPGPGPAVGVAGGIAGAGVGAAVRGPGPNGSGNGAGTTGGDGTGVHEPESRGAGAPGAPGADAVGELGAGAAGPPGAGAAGAPGGGVSGAPGGGVPGTSGAGAPGASGADAHGASGGGAPGASGGGVPGTSGPGAPGASGGGVTGTSGPGAPGAPGAGAPGASGLPGTGAAGAGVAGAGTQVPDGTGAGPAHDGDAGPAPGSGGAPLADSPGPLPWEAGDPVTTAHPRQAEPPTNLIGPAEPATAYVTSPGNPATAAWTRDPETDVLPVVDAYDQYPHDGATTLSPAPEPDRGRSPAMLIGVGGVVAAVAVVGALVFWPNEQTVSNATPQLPAVPTAAPPPPTTESAPTTESERRTRERTVEQDPDSSAPVPPPVVPTLPPAPPTSAAPTTTKTQGPGPTTTTSPVPPPPGPQPR